MSTESELIQMQEETNKIIESIEAQKLDEGAINAFIYAIFIVVAISMILEIFVRSYKEQIRNKKDANEPVKNIRIKLLIIYGIHIAALIILWLVCTYALKFTGIYTWFLIAITVYIVEIAPLFTIRFKKKKDKGTPNK